MCFFVLSRPVWGQAKDASFIEGYAAATLEDFKVRPGTVAVEGSTVSISASGLNLTEKEAVARTLLRVPGVEVVRFPPDPRAFPLDRPVKPSPWRAFPTRPVFEPLLADPRWPRFSGSYLYFNKKTPGVGQIFSGNFGDYFGLMGWETDRAQWQLGIQAGVFTIWNMDTYSNDLINSDFVVGLPLSWRGGRWSAMARLYHVSTHLGDEYVLTHTVARINLSQESVDLRVSYDVFEPLRVYAGGGMMVRRDPPETKPGSLQAGAEYRHPRAYLRGLVRPMAGLDLRKYEQNGWARTGVSFRAGTQIENRSYAGRKLAILAEYYNGRDPNGQFYKRSIEYGGLGLHCFF